MEKLKTFIFSIIMFAVAGFVVWHSGPDLLSDVQHMGDKTDYAQAHEFVEGECSTQLLVLAMCEMEIVSVANGVQDIKYMMLSGLGDIELDVLEYEDGTVATSLGVEGLWNRIGFFAVVFSVLFFTATSRLLSIFKSSAEQDQTP